MILSAAYHNNHITRIKHSNNNNYKANGTLNAISLLSRPKDFFNATTFPPRLFIEKLLNPVREYLSWPRNWTEYVPPDATEFNHKKHACQLSIPDRLLRFCMWLKGTNTTSLKLHFGQNENTIIEDVIFIANMINKALSSRYLFAPKPNTQEYNSLVGAGVFDGIFDKAIYMIDVTLCPMPKPAGAYERSYYDAHHKQHAMGFLTMCDGFGIVRYIYGPSPGASHDLKMYNESDLFLHQRRYIDDNHLILADGACHSKPILSKFHGREYYTDWMRAFNYEHDKCRSLMENTYGRSKKKYDIISNKFPLHRKHFLPIFRAATIFCNILN